MNADEIKAELVKHLPDLKQQLTVVGVPDLVQAHIAKAKFCSIAKFQVLAVSAEGLLVTCKRLGLDSEASMENLGIASSVVLGWQIAKQCKRLQ